MEWIKLGKIFEANGQRDWMLSHTACPSPYLVNDDLLRVYFGTRDSENSPSIGFVDLSINDDFSVRMIPEKPCLSRGEWGFFDDNGVYPGPILLNGDKMRLYYMGRSNGTPPLFYMAIGLAESEDDGLTFSRLSPAPVLSRSTEDPWMVSTPFVFQESEKDWKMWYTSGIGWVSKSPPKSKYQIKCAESSDGVAWTGSGMVSIPIEGKETNLASPWFWREGQNWHGLYCVAGQTDGYSLCETKSKDGIFWQKLGTPKGLERSPSGWDSNCMAYPSSFTHKGTRYCLYSGNENGKGGIGVARLEK